MDASLACRYLGDLNSMFLISNIITRRLSKAADTSVEALEWTLEGGVGTPTDGNAQRAIPSWSWSPFPSWSPPPSEGAMVVYTPPLADPPKTYLRSLAENLAWGAGMLYSTTGSLAGVMQPMTAYGCNGLATAAGAMAVALQPMAAYGCNGLATAAGAMAVALQPMAAYGCNGLATAAGAMAEALRPAPVVVDPSMSTKDLVQVAVAAGVGTCVVLFAVAATARGVVAVRA
jgi:hypothetical protein